MSNIEWEFYDDNISGIMRSSEMVKVLTEHANAIKNRCSGSYELSEHIGPTRANVSIYTEDRKTLFKNLKDNELAKALR